MPRKRQGEDGLTTQEALFVRHYIACGCNGTEAARRTGYRGNANVLAVQAHNLLRRPKVQEALDEFRRAAEMSAYEAIQRMSDIARVSLGDFLDDQGHIDIAKASEAAKLHLIREFRQETIRTGGRGESRKEIVRSTLKLHDAQAALVTMMKYHGLLAENPSIPKDPKELDEFILREFKRIRGEPDPEDIH